MPNESQVKPSPYRWLMLLLITLPNFGTNFAQFQLSAFATDFTRDFGLTMTLFSAVTLSYTVAAGVIGVCGGTLADKLGTRRVAVALAFLSAAASLLRLTTRSYLLFFLLSLLVGAVLGCVHATSGKIISAWFPARQAGLAFSLYCGLGGAGIALAQLTFPLYSGYRQALLIAGLVLLLTAALWLLFGRDAPKGAVLPPSQPVLKYIGKTVRLKNVWLVAVCCASFVALMFSVSALLPTVLTALYGLSPARANTVTSALNLAAITGSVLLPPVQVRLGRFRPMMATLILLAFASLVSILLAPEALVLPLVCLLGLSISVLCGFFMTILSALPEVGAEYLGSAAGIVTFVHYTVGGFLLPSFVITPLMGLDQGMLFVCGAGLCLVMLLGTLLLPETGKR